MKSTESVMKPNGMLHGVLWFIIVTAAVAAQGAVPDFSGRWILEPGQPSVADVARALSIRQSLVRTTARGEPMTPFFKDVSVVREFGTGSRTETYQIGVVGGSVSGAAGVSAARAASHHRVTWDNHTLVIESGSYTGPSPESGQWTERRETWSLDPAGRLRVAIMTRGSGSSSVTVTLLYRRP